MPHNVIQHAHSLRKLGKYPEAAVIVRNCLATCPEKEFEVSGSLNALLGQLELDQGRYANALTHYKDAYMIYHAGHLESKAHHALRHIAEIETELGIHKEAQRNFKKVIQYYTQTDSSAHVNRANAFRAYAILLEKMQNPEEARSTWEDALAIYSELGIQEGVKECKTHLTNH